MANVRRRPIPSPDIRPLSNRGSHCYRDCSTQACASLSLTRAENNSWNIDVLEWWRLGIILQRTGSHLVVPRTLLPARRGSWRSVRMRRRGFCRNTCKLCTIFFPRDLVWLSLLLLIQKSQPSTKKSVTRYLGTCISYHQSTFITFSRPHFHPLSQLSSTDKNGLIAPVS